MVLLLAVAVPAAAAAYSLSQDEQYTARAQLLFRDPGFDQALLGGSSFFLPSLDPDREAATNVKLVSLPTVAQRTAERLGPGITQDEVRGKVEVADEGLSNLVSVAATDEDPVIASQLANVFASEFIAFRRQADRSKIREALRLTQQQLTRFDLAEAGTERARLLRRRADQLETLAALQTGNAELVQEARPPANPISPRPRRNTAIGAVIGLLLGIGLALLLDRFDRRLREPHDVEEVFERPIVGVIPESNRLRRSKDPGALRGQEADAFRMLRANLRYFDIDREVKSLVITSAAPGDGKTTVAWNLATISAAAGARVLLIEADLRHPVLTERYHLAPSAGLSTVLADHRQIHDQGIDVLQVPATPRTKRGYERTMDVLVAGPQPPNPTDLLESERTHELIRATELEYDLVIVDTPPMSVVPDAIPLLGWVSGVLVVSRLGKSTRSPALHLRRQLDNVGAPVLGLVINSLTRDVSSYYGHEYSYAYYYEHSEGKGEDPEDGGDPQQDRDSTAVVAARKADSEGEKDQPLGDSSGRSRWKSLRRSPRR